MTTKDRYKIIGAIGGIALLLMIVVGFNPNLFQGFILQQIQTNDQVGVFQNGFEVSSRQSGGATIDTAVVSCSNLVRQAAEQIRQGEEVNMNELIDNLRRVNKCSCQFIEQLFSQLNYTDAQIRETLIRADLSSEYRCSLPATPSEPVENPEPSQAETPPATMNPTEGMSTIYTTNVQRPGNTVIDPADPASCAQQQEEALKNLRSEVHNTYVEIERLKAAGCECPAIHQVIRQLGFTSDEAINRYLENADQVACQISSEPTSSTPVFNCADYRQMAEMSINAYRETGNHEYLADALLYMLKIDTGCCDFCGASAQSSASEAVTPSAAGTYQLLLPPGN